MIRIFVDFKCFKAVNPFTRKLLSVFICHKGSKIRYWCFPVSTPTRITKVCVAGDKTRPVLNEHNGSHRNEPHLYASKSYVFLSCSYETGSGMWCNSRFENVLLKKYVTLFIDKISPIITIS
jgi:hypothetical protein